MAADPHRTFLLRGGLVMALVLLAVVLINRAVNPYSLFATDWIARSSKPETYTHLRMVKAAQVRHVQPRAVILGSSRVETALSPDHACWSESPVYNLGLSEAVIYEILRYFQHAVAVAEVRQAVLLLDYSAFLSAAKPAPDFTEERLAVSREGKPQPSAVMTDWLTALGTSDALIGSLGTWHGVPGEKDYLANGVRVAAAENRRVLEKGGSAKAFAVYERSIFPQLARIKPELEPQAFQCFREILQLAKARRIDLRLGISPIHARFLEMLHLSGHGTGLKEWLRQLAEIAAQESSSDSRFQVLDFSGYNAFTTEPVPASGLGRWYYEDSHFTMALGDVILERLWKPALEQAPPDGFGIVLSPEMLERHHVETMKARERYRMERQGELQALDAIIR